MHDKGQRVFGSRVAVAIAAVIVGAVIATGVAAANVPLNSVNSSKIVNGSIQRVDLANNVINSGKIANGSVTSADIANGAQVVAESEAEANAGIAGNGANQIAESVTINARTAGQLLITGSFRPDATVDDVFGCAILVDNVFDSASSRQVEAFGAAPDNDCSTNTGVTVAAGNHTVDLQSSGLAVGNDIQQTSLQVLFVPNL